MTRNRTLTAVAFALVLLTASLALAVPARAYTVRPTHPRIWLTPETLTRLRAQAAANTPRWRSLLNLCDSSRDADWDVGVMNYALVYQVTGNPAYADKAITLMQGWVNGGMDAITADSGYPARSVLPGMAVAYDWCYDRLTPAQRTLFRTQMEAWADWVWPETNPSRSSGWSVTNPGDNYYHGFMMTWMVGLALAGDSPKATGYIDLALKKWNQTVRPYLDQYSAGGYALEGTTYGAGSMFRMFWYLAAHTSATGEDLFNAAGVVWPRQAMLCKLYLTAPTRERVYPGGDQARVSSAPLSDYDRSAGLVGLNYLDKTTAGYARWWLDHISPNRNEWKFTQWEELLWYREDVAAVDYTQTLPVGYLAAGAGWMTSRSSWATDAVQVAMMCGPTREAHQDRAQNGFVIYGGNWLAAMARLPSHDGLFGETAYHNSLTIGGYGQTPNQGTARVAHFGDTARYAYFAGDAPEAYDIRVRDAQNNVVDLSLLTQFRRELVFLKPNRVIVFDRVNARDASQVKKWHLHSLKAPLLGRDTYQATVGNATLFGKSLLPANATLTQVPMNLGSNGETTSWRIDEIAPVGQKLDHFLNVMEVAPASQAAPTAASAIQTERATLMGCQIGDQVVLFDVASAAGSSVGYQTGVSAAREHFVLDQTPGQWYHVVEATLAGETLAEQRAQATDQGVVSFTTTGTGARRISLRPLATPLDVLSVTFSPAEVTGGAACRGEITLSAPAPAGGTSVTLTSSDAGVGVPASVQVAAGATTATFPVTTQQVLASKRATLTVSYTGMTRTATLEITPPAMQSLLLTPRGIAGAGSVAGTVTLGGPAPAGGTVINLTSGAPSVVRVPAQVTIAAGAVSANFTLTVDAAGAAAAVAITATGPGAPVTTLMTVAPRSTLAAGAMRHIAVFRPSQGEWLLREPDGTATLRRLGEAGDRPVSADYLGSGQAQAAAFHPATAEWLIQREDGQTLRVQFGTAGDVPVPGDYQGLHRTQIAVFRPATAEWFIRQDNGVALRVKFGAPGDWPVPADYFGLGRSQIAVFRPATAQWFLRRDAGSTVPLQWGAAGDLPVPGDYFGLSRAQIAVFRPLTREWFLRSDAAVPTRVQFGGPGDLPVPFDYLGVGRLLLAVFRPQTGEWFVRTDGGSTLDIPWGRSGDLPVPAAFGP